MIGNPGPDGIKHCSGHAAPELLSDATDEVGQEDSNVEAWEVAGTEDDDVANCRVPECSIRSCTGAEPDQTQYDGLIEINAIKRNVAGKCQESSHQASLRVVLGSSYQCAHHSGTH